jgi:hypothetical protein
MKYKLYCLLSLFELILLNNSLKFLNCESIIISDLKINLKNEGSTNSNKPTIIKHLKTDNFLQKEDAIFINV